MCFLILSSKSVLPENRLFSFNATFFFVTSHSAKVSASSKRTCRSEILLLPFCNKLANLKEEEGEKKPKTYLSNCLSAGSILITSSSPASSPSAASAASVQGSTHQGFSQHSCSTTEQRSKPQRRRPTG